MRSRLGANSRLGAKPTGMRSRLGANSRLGAKNAVPSWCELAWSRLGANSAEISEIAVDREIFHVLGLLGLRRILPLWEKCFYSFTKPLLLKYVVHIVHSWYNLVQCYS